MSASARLAVDIGGTFTDFALDHAGQRTSAKVLTTPQAPETGVLARPGVDPGASRDRPPPNRHHHPRHDAGDQRDHRAQGRKTALVVTEGFRDSIEMAFEHRFEQYDIFMDKPPPLVPRTLRLPVPERMDARGNVVPPWTKSAGVSCAAFERRKNVERRHRVPAFVFVARNTSGAPGDPERD